MEAVVTSVVKHRIADWDHGTSHRELRMPLGLVLLSRGWITRDELNAALAAQRQHGQGRIGEWLCRMGVLSESTVAKGLAAQWNCTALTASTGGLEQANDLVPSILLDYYGLVLMRNRLNSHLYLAGNSRAECAAGRAFERMLDVPVEPAFLEDAFWRRHSPADSAADSSRPSQLGAVIEVAQALERFAPGDARVVRIHDHLWLRMFDVRRRRSRSGTEDLVVALRARRDC